MDRLIDRVAGGLVELALPDKSWEQAHHFGVASFHVRRVRDLVIQTTTLVLCLQVWTKEMMSEIRLPGAGFHARLRSIGATDSVGNIRWVFIRFRRDGVGRSRPRGNETVLSLKPLPTDSACETSG